MTSALIDDALFEQRIGEAHHDAAVNLAFEQQRVDRAAAIVHGDHALDPYDAAFGIDSHFGELHAADVGVCQAAEWRHGPESAVIIAAPGRGADLILGKKRCCLFEAHSAPGVIAPEHAATAKLKLRGTDVQGRRDLVQEPLSDLESGLTSCRRHRTCHFAAARADSAGKIGIADTDGNGLRRES